MKQNATRRGRGTVPLLPLRDAFGDFAEENYGTGTGPDKEPDAEPGRARRHARATANARRIGK